MNNFKKLLIKIIPILKNNKGEFIGGILEFIIISPIIIMLIVVPVQIFFKNINKNIAEYKKQTNIISNNSNQNLNFKKMIYKDINKGTD